MSKLIVTPFCIPAEIKAIQRWCGWRAEPSASGKPTKKPYKATGGPFHISQAEQDLDSFEHVMTAYERDVLDGINFLPGDGIAGLDFDDCSSEDGVLGPHVEAIIEELGTYAEYSPSGRGVRVFFRFEGELQDIVDAGTGFECFANGKHTLSVTGNANLGTPRTLATVSADTVRDLYQNWQAESPNGDQAIDTRPEPPAKEPEVEFKDAAEYPPASAEDVVELVDRCLPLLLDSRAEDYDKWLKVGFALRSAEEQSGEDFTDRWHEFSRRSAKYDADEALAKWEGLDPHSISYRSLLHWAQEDSRKTAAEIQTPATNHVDFRTKWPLLTAEQLLAEQDEPVAWLYEWWLARQCLTMLVGPPKEGKTTYAYHVIREMAEGGSLGGKILPARVLLIAEESRPAMRQRISLIGVEQLAHVRWVFRPFKTRPSFAAWAAFMEGLGDVCHEDHIDLVVLDSWQKLSPVENENDSAQAEAATKPVQELADAANLACLILHHSSKAGPAGINAARGSNALAAQMDIIANFTRYQPADPYCSRRKLNGLGRFDQVPIEQIVKWEGGRYVESAKPEVERKTTAVQIVNDKGDGMTAAEVREAWPEPTPGARQVRAILNQAVEKGDLGCRTSEDAQTKGPKPRVYFRTLGQRF